jgi:hypothetical protein
MTWFHNPLIFKPAFGQAVLRFVFLQQAKAVVSKADSLRQLTLTQIIPSIPANFKNSGNNKECICG